MSDKVKKTKHKAKLSKQEFDFIKQIINGTDITNKKLALNTGWSESLIRYIRRFNTYEDYQDFLKIKYTDKPEQQDLSLVVNKVAKDNNDLVRIVKLLENINNSLKVLAEKVDSRKDRRWF